MPTLKVGAGAVMISGILAIPSRPVAGSTIWNCTVNSPSVGGMNANCGPLPPATIAFFRSSTNQVALPFSAAAFPFNQPSKVSNAPRTPVAGPLIATSSATGVAVTVSGAEVVAVVFVATFRNVTCTV